MLCLNGFSRRYSAVLRFAKFSILTSSLEVETFLCYLLSLLFFYPSGISHSFVSSARWRKFLWVLLGGLLASRFARALSRERGIQLQFAADSFCMMTIPPSFLVKDNAKTFFFLFCQDDEDDEGYFGSSLTFVGQILFCYARFVLSSAKIFQSSDAGRGGRGEPLMGKQQH